MVFRLILNFSRSISYLTHDPRKLLFDQFDKYFLLLDSILCITVKSAENSFYFEIGIEWRASTLYCMMWLFTWEVILYFCNIGFSLLDDTKREGDVSMFSVVSWLACSPQESPLVWLITDRIKPTTKKLADHCLSFCPFFLLTIALCVLIRFTASDYPFGIFKLCL
jgi:hypothetical protein